jgi:hypothetical protein
METIGRNQAEEMPGLDYSIQSLLLLQQALESKDETDRDFVKAGAYFGEVLRSATGVGEWVSPSSLSRSGAPELSFGKWNVDPIDQTVLVFDRSRNAPKETLATRAQFIIDALLDDRVRESLKIIYNAPTAFERIRAARRRTRPYKP